MSDILSTQRHPSAKLTMLADALHLPVTDF